MVENMSKKNKAKKSKKKLFHGVEWRPTLHESEILIVGDTGSVRATVATIRSTRNPKDDSFAMKVEAELDWGVSEDDYSKLEVKVTSHDTFTTEKAAKQEAQKQIDRLIAWISDRDDEPLLGKVTS